MSRSEFPVKTRKLAWDRAAGLCECGCGMPFTSQVKDRPNYDHRIPDYSGGKNDLENCMVIRFCCHALKTKTKDMPIITKIRREDKRRKGFERRKNKIAGSKGSGFRKKMNGTVVRIKE